MSDAPSTPAADLALDPALDPPGSAGAPAAATPVPAAADPAGHAPQEELNLAGSALATFVVVLIAVAIFGVLARAGRTPPVKPFVETKVGVRVVTLGPKRVVPRVEGFGRARPRRRVSIAAETGGRILSIHPQLEDGHTLPQGATVVEIEPADAAAALAQAEAQLASAKAEVRRLEAQRGWLEQRRVLAQETLALEEAEFARAKDLKSRGIDTDRNLDAARSAVVRARDAQIGVLQSQDLLGPQLQVAEAKVAEAEARQRSAALELTRCTITLPFAGLIAKVAVEAHQRVNPGQVLFELWDTERLEVPVALTLSDALLLSDRLGADPGLGQVEVRYELPGTIQRWQGRVLRFEPLDAQTQTLRAVVEVRNPGEEASQGSALVPDAFCTVTIEGPPRELQLALPIDAIQEGGRVYVAREVEGVARLAIASVRTGRQVGGWVEVLAGLEPGEQVIVSPMERAVEGTPLVPDAEPRQGVSK